MRFPQLSDWLRWQETLNPRAIELGLERVRSVAERLGLQTAACPVITVGGTNGKGSCVAFLEAILGASGYRVGAYTSPHVRRYNERIRIHSTEVADDALCRAFDAIDRVRGSVALTYFEFGTLAALWLFREAALDAVLLEVGLGGRLDAVNLIDADAALVTSVGLDHTDWLGTDRDSIAFEKAGIFRKGRPAVCGDPDPPPKLVNYAHDIGARFYRIGTHFRPIPAADGLEWTWQGWEERLEHLPTPFIAGSVQLANAASVIAVLRSLRHRLPVSEDAVRKGLRSARLRGRFEIRPGAIPVIFDVAHNAEACAVLVENLQRNAVQGRTRAVLGMLRDKPVESIGAIMDRVMDAWYVGGLEKLPRGLPAEDLALRLGERRGGISRHADIPAAFRAAMDAARLGDRIVVFGSFHTVEAVQELIDG